MNTPIGNERYANRVQRELASAAPDLDEQQIETALKEELERVTPRSDLWLLVRAGVRRQQRKHRRRQQRKHRRRWWMAL